ncbi:MAG: hypothetical protein AAFP81_01980 [Pseudomonadota bacterium]
MGLSASVGTVLYDPYKRGSCVGLGGSPFSAGRAGYEIVDVGRRVVWGTADWTPSAFQGFKPPWHKPLYRKNDPRVGYADSGKITKSPGCEFDGQYNTLRAFGRDFRQVVRLISFERIGSGESQLQQVTLEKYHTLLYREGTVVRVLHTPDETQYIAVSRSARPEGGPNPLPEGWRIGTYQLSCDFPLELSGTVINIRTPNRDSFQGPLQPRHHFPR